MKKIMAFLSLLSLTLLTACSAPITDPNTGQPVAQGSGFSDGLIGAGVGFLAGRMLGNRPSPVVNQTHTTIVQHNYRPPYKPSYVPQKSYNYRPSMPSYRSSYRPSYSSYRSYRSK
jgi:hypothetical protein